MSVIFEFDGPTKNAIRNLFGYPPKGDEDAQVVPKKEPVSRS